jgi:hypothetical protein
VFAVAFVAAALLASNDPQPASPPTAEPAPAAEPAAETEPSPSPVVVPHVRRVALQDIVVEGENPRLGPVLSDALVAELRKLASLSVISMVEVRALLAQEAAKQLAGCTSQSCVAEIADALGADIVVSGAVAMVGGEWSVSLRRADLGAGFATKTVSRRVEAKDGEEVLALIGPMVAELFPDVALRAGAVRGASLEHARRLNPPPLGPVPFAVAAGAAGLAVVAAAALGVTTAAVASDLDARAAASVSHSVAGRSLLDEQALGSTLFTGAVVAGGAGVAFTAVTGALWPFTDFSEPEVTP